MSIIRKLIGLFSVLAILVTAGCARTPTNGSPIATDHQIAELAQGIRALGPEVDPEEADRAARISFEYTYQLALQYQITDGPLVHNVKVNRGLRPRGLCWHWAEDIEARLKQENFQTLDLHRAIANADSRILIDHSTAIISRRGDTMFQGVVLDPWRKGGKLFWSPIGADTRYKWRPRMEVLEKRRLGQLAKEASAAGSSEPVTY